MAYAGEDFSECLKTGQYLLNQKWNEIQKSLTMILTLFSPSQSQDKLQTKYNQLKVSFFVLKCPIIHPFFIDNNRDFLGM